MTKNKYYIDDKAVVKTDKIGRDSAIWQFCVVLDGAKIGSNVNINAHCLVENDVVIGNDVTIKSGVYLWDGIIIEDKVQIGPNATFTNDKYPRAKAHDFELERTVVKEGASIGAAATILGGTTIGRYALLGADTLITKDVPDYALVYGTPAEIHGYVCECAQKLEFKDDIAICTTKDCGKQYRMDEEKVVRTK